LVLVLDLKCLGLGRGLEGCCFDFGFGLKWVHAEENVVGVVRRALDVLDLLLTFQFNTRLESFIAKFKTAEVSASTKKSKLRSILVPLLYDDFDPFDTTKSVVHRPMGYFSV